VANITVTLFFVLVLLVGGVFLQIFLSKKNSKWFGLILPAITFLYSLLMVLGLAVYDGMSGGEIFILIASTFLLNNIPTIVLLGIYFGCREKMKLRAELEKMSIQDLK
jgi:FtsH-binding integral membrane protein